MTHAIRPLVVKVGCVVLMAGIPGRRSRSGDQGRLARRGVSTASAELHDEGAVLEGKPAAAGGCRRGRSRVHDEYCYLPGVPAAFAAAAASSALAPARMPAIA